MSELIRTFEEIRSVLTTQGTHERQLQNATAARLEKLRGLMSEQSDALDDSQKTPVLLGDGLYFEPVSKSLKIKGLSYSPDFEEEVFDMSWDSDLWFQHAEKISSTLVKRASLLPIR